MPAGSATHVPQGLCAGSCSCACGMAVKCLQRRCCHPYLLPSLLLLLPAGLRTSAWTPSPPSKPAAKRRTAAPPSLHPTPRKRSRSSCAAPKQSAARSPPPSGSAAPLARPATLCSAQASGGARPPCHDERVRNRRSLCSTCDGMQFSSADEALTDGTHQDAV